MLTMLVVLVVLGSAIFVAVDAAGIGARKGLVDGMADMGPAGWFFSVLLLWLVAFPLYLAKRGEIKMNARMSGRR